MDTIFSMLNVAAESVEPAVSDVESAVSDVESATSTVETAISAVESAVSDAGSETSSVESAVEVASDKFTLVNIDFPTIVFTLINTLIIVLLYFFFLHKPVCKILDARAEAVNKDMDDAEKAKSEAEAVKAEYEERLQSSKEEASRIVAEASKRAQAREEEIISQANSEAAAIKMRAEESIEREKKRAVNEIKGEISEMVVMAASAVAEKEITAADNERIIDTVIGQIGEN